MTSSAAVAALGQGQQFSFKVQAEWGQGAGAHSLPYFIEESSESQFMVNS